MSESYNRFYTGDVSEEDMLEAPRRVAEPGIGRAGRVLFVCLAVLGLLLVLVHGSQPALTPEEIVQSETYEGEQEARRIFNLYSLKQERAREEVAAKASSVDESGPDVVVVTAVQPPRIAPSALPVAATEPSDQQPEKVNDAEIRSTARPYEKAELSRVNPAVVISKTKPDEREENTPEPQAAINSGLKMLPVYPLSRDNVVLRETPSDASRSIAVLPATTRVTLFNVDGSWAQVATNDGSGKTGYVRRTDLGADLEQ